ncbi:helix-turn-helix domain-containing protein [Achromobacter sp. Marseille-Q0513]|nr:helix-turn-helix domain-containing protein [Achromobacter sp. Marseille-Q0513]
MEQPVSEPISALEAARLLGVSPRHVYDLAAPDGPIPCYRVGRRISFELTDLLEYRQSCRSIATQNAVSTSLNSTARLKVRESALVAVFRKHGLEPRPTPSTARNPHGSTQSRPALRVIGQR